MTSAGEGLGHELGGVLVPQHDVDFLAVQLGDDGLDPGSALAHRRPLGVHPGWRLSTATFERLPASRAMPRITTEPL